MDWKEKGTETVFVGIIAFLGSIFVKKFRPAWKEIKRIAALADTVDELKKEAAISKAREIAIFDTETDPIFILNEKGEVKYVNTAWLQMTGMRTQTDAYGMGYMRVIPEKDRERISEQNEMLNKHPSSSEDSMVFEHFVTKEHILTIYRSQPVFYNGTLVETVGRIKIIDKKN